jgi:hypothetical protein
MCLLLLFCIEPTAPVNASSQTANHSEVNSIPNLPLRKARFAHPVDKDDGILFANATGKVN